MKRLISLFASGLLLSANLAFADETGTGTPSASQQSVSTQSIIIEESECTILDWLLGECE